MYPRHLTYIHIISPESPQEKSRLHDHQIYDESLAHIAVDTVDKLLIYGQTLTGYHFK